MQYLVNQAPYSKVNIGNRFKNMELFWAYTTYHNSINNPYSYFLQRNGAVLNVPTGSSNFSSGTQFCIESELVAPKYSNDVVAVASFSKKQSVKIFRAGLLEMRVQGTVPNQSFGAFLEVDDNLNVSFIVQENALAYYKKALQQWNGNSGAIQRFFENIYDERHTIAVHWDKSRGQFTLFLYDDDLIILDQTPPLRDIYPTFMQRQLGVSIYASDGQITVDNMALFVSPYRYHRVTSLNVSPTPVTTPLNNAYYPLAGLGLNYEKRQCVDVLEFSARQAGAARNMAVALVKTYVHNAALFALFGGIGAYNTNMYAVQLQGTVPALAYSGADMLLDACVLPNSNIDIIKSNKVLKNVVSSSAMVNAETTNLMRYFAWLAVITQGTPTAASAFGTLTFAEY